MSDLFDPPPAEFINAPDFLVMGALGMPGTAADIARRTGLDAEQVTAGLAALLEDGRAVSIDGSLYRQTTEFENEDNAFGSRTTADRPVEETGEDPAGLFGFGRIDAESADECGPDLGGAGPEDRDADGRPAGDEFADGAASDSALAAGATPTGIRRAALNGGIAAIDLFGEICRPSVDGILKQRFLLPPFSVLSARDGDWQERKRMWLSLGIQSELGRGDVLPGGGGGPETKSAWLRHKPNAIPGGAMLPLDRSAK